MDLGEIFEEAEKGDAFCIHSFPATTHGLNGSVFSDDHPIIYYKFVGVEKDAQEADAVDLLSGDGKSWRLYRFSAREMRDRAREGRPINIDKKNPLYCDDRALRSFLGR